MSKHTTSEISLNKQRKDKLYFTQYQKTVAAFRSSPKTMLMVAKEIGIERANICRYIGTMKKAGIVWLVSKQLCKISKNKAGYYTTDPEKAPAIQLTLSL